MLVIMVWIPKQNPILHPRFPHFQQERKYIQTEHISYLHHIYSENSNYEKGNTCILLNDMIQNKRQIYITVLKRLLLRSNITQLSCFFKGQIVSVHNMCADSAGYKFRKVTKAVSERSTLAMARSARLPMLQCWYALPLTAIAVAKVDHSDTA